jgi:hypothetical protein
VSRAIRHAAPGACPGDRVADGLVREVVGYYDQTKVAELFA